MLYFILYVIRLLLPQEINHYHHYQNDATVGLVVFLNDM